MASDADRLASGTIEVVPAGGLERKLALGRPLRVKLGVDPSRPDLTLGHAVVLGKLRQFQDAGHQAILIIGDFTARIGDPSGVSEMRPMLTAEEVSDNARTYLEQAGAVIDVEAAEIRGNAEWLGTLDMPALIGLASTATVARMLEREDFRDRFQAGRPISVVELLYPLLQGYDSVAVRADVELGGTDQTFNLLMGRDVQRAHAQEPQVVVTVPLLEGLDGERKMSKSLDNYVGLTEPPDEMFGKLMSIPDGLIARYELLCLQIDPQEHARIEAGLADRSLRPNEEKRRMARAVVDRYHGPGSGADAEAAFDRIHREHRLPEEVPEFPVSGLPAKDGKVSIAHALAAAGLASSTSEARRLIEGGGVRLDGQAVQEVEMAMAPEQLRGRVLQVGRRRFVRIV